MKRLGVPLTLLLAALVLGVVVTPEPPPGFDLDASRALQAAIGPRCASLEVTSAVLQMPWNLVLGLALALVLWRLLDRRSALFLLACMLFSVALVHSAKVAYGRSRPSPELVRGGIEHSTASYPSGHVGWTASVLGALAMLATRRRGVRYAWLAWCAALLGVTWVALSRVYLGRHYVTDTVGAALLAAAVVAFCARALVPRGPGS